MALRVIYATNRVLPYQICHRNIDTLPNSSNKLKQGPNVTSVCHLSLQPSQFISRSTLLPDWPHQSEFSWNNTNNMLQNLSYERLDNQENFLRHRLAVVRARLLSGSKTYRDHVEEKFLSRLENKVVPKYVQDVIKEELCKLEHTECHRHEFDSTRNYLNWLTSLPWGITSQENFNLLQAVQILDQDLYGQEEVKQYILAIMAGWKLKANIHGNILCLVGETGVGKATLAKSIARALNRKFYRFSLNGVKDVTVIKGKNKSSVRAKPGKIIQCLAKVQTENPLILVEEIDELGDVGPTRGVSSSEIFEFLDPRQNSSFVDYYLDVPVDLSKVLFICTAHDKDAIRKSLRNRMELIEIRGYGSKKKLAIAKYSMLPKMLQEFGLNTEQVTLTDDDLSHLIEKSGSTLGVRDLQNVLERVAREAALQILKNGLFTKSEKPSSHDWKLVDILAGYCLVSGIVLIVGYLRYENLNIFQVDDRLKRFNETYKRWWRTYVKID